MPLDTAALSANCTFDFVTAVAGWADATQGTNQVTFGGEIDTADWNQAYAALLVVAGSGSTTIDLKSLTNLAGEAVAFTAVLAIVAKVAPTVTADTATAVTIGPGASNGLEWVAGADDLPVAVNESFVKLGDPAGAGVTVDATHKTLTVANGGTDSATVTLVIIGTTL